MTGNHLILFEGSIIYGRKFPVLPVFDFHLCSSGNNLLPARIIFGTCNLISFIVIRNFPVGKVKFITIAVFPHPSGQSGAADSGNSDSAVSGTEVGLSANYKYAEFSKINSGKAILYKSTAASRKNKTVCVNAGHGTKGGSSVKTLCHPDGTPKVTGGTTGAGATTAVAVSGGMTFADGTAESKVTLQMAKILKDRLLAEGYDVLMIRESDDVQLDNIARTVIANNNADAREYPREFTKIWDTLEFTHAFR